MRQAGDRGGERRGARAGFGLMAACDIMMASETAVFGMPEIDVGLAGGAAMVNRAFSKSFARRFMFKGDRLPAASCTGSACSIPSGRPGIAAGRDEDGRAHRRKEPARHQNTPRRAATWSS